MYQDKLLFNNMKHAYKVVTTVILFILWINTGFSESKLPPESEQFSNPVLNQHLIEIYEKEAATWPDTSLIGVAICYAKRGKPGDIEKAEDLYKKYLIVKPDDARATRGLGNVYLMQNNRKEALEQFKKGWKLKDVSSLKWLSILYAESSNWEELGKLIPDLLEKRKNQPDSIEFLLPIISYALNQKPPAKDLFYQSIEGIPDEELVTREGIRKLVFVALERFEDYGRLEKLKRKIKEKT